ncbi:FAD-dependent monooxygenase [Kutzneria chonburiensis]|uniref:FAD-dependent monooxygenase n=1 Tax=Kutzneria chonburiensis TaxID=1483604 RepID=A0ABV6MWC4_9PSEU|nr:FAD-dependent monooxygenase [Kutzneria chonburiensis]
MDSTRTQVLVAGAGLAGTATSMFLADRGIEPLVVERNPETSLRPKALEPIGLDRARELGAHVRFDTELVSFEQDTLGVTARLVHRPTGTLSQVRADYMIAADGHRSPIRERLGVDTFRSGRVFLAGDAARVTPPTGELGDSTAIADGFDLAWKLAAVLRNQAGPGLLDSYDAERRPVAPELRNLRLRSAAVLIDDEDPALTEDPHRPSGRPGFRAPHVPLRQGGKPVSTVDFFGRDWVLLTGTEGGVWHEAAKHVADRLGIVVRTVGLGPGLTDPDDRLVSAYGIGHGGASLVRPDGVVAWRTDFEVADAAGTLQTVLTRLLARVPSVAVPAGTAR